MIKTKKKIIYLSVFLVLALFLISSCQTIGRPISSQKQVVDGGYGGNVECPVNCQCDEKGNVLSCSIGGGVLDIFSKCSVVDGSDSGIFSPENYNCNNVCLSKNLNCALGIGTFKAPDSSIGDQKVVIRSCKDSTSPYNTYLSCFCCSPN